MSEKKSDSAQAKLIAEAEWLNRKIEELQEDIDSRGVTYIAISSTGKEYEKDNPSAKLIIQYSRQRVAIMKELGIIEKVEQEASVDSDGDYF